MRKIIGLAFSLLAGLAFANDLTDAGLLGKVKATDEQTFAMVQSFGQWSQSTAYASRITAVYDAKGNRTEGASYNADGSLWLKSVYAYDAKGNRTEETSYNADGSLWLKWVYTYDAKGNMTEEAVYEADGSLWLKWVYTYENDTQGNWTKKATSKEVNKYGRNFLEPTETVVRVITYYP
jgi:hypothetical protein